MAMLTSKQDKKRMRRLEEARKALEKSQIFTKPAALPAKTPAKTTSSSFQLPIVEIKHDIMKNLVYTVFAVVAVVALNKSSEVFTLFTKYFKF